jgi:hypothetical protein
MLELIALTLVAAVAFLFVQHGVPYLAERIRHCQGR